MTEDEEHRDGEQKLARVTKADEPQAALFDLPPDWRKEWWGMPDYGMGDARPEHRISVNFASWDDVKEFARRLDLNISKRCDSTWFPPEQLEKPGNWHYICARPTPPRYPIYIPSKGRWETNYTAKRLRTLGVPFRVVVEETEADQYARALGRDCLLVLPFHDLGQGSIPARNWIWEHAIADGHERHWVIDDNVSKFYRMNLNRRIPASDGSIFVAAEAFVDRYENVALAGLNNIAWAPDRPDIAAFAANTRIYSITLIKNDLPYRWRGKYNEDTDLSLRVLKAGWVTIQFNAFLANKHSTLTMKGGNTDNVYNTNDHRRAFAESLKAQHPDVVEVTWKYGRWHHQVDYSPFKRNKLKLRAGVTRTAAQDNFGMALRRRSDAEALRDGPDLEAGSDEAALDEGR